MHLSRSRDRVASASRRGAESSSPVTLGVADAVRAGRRGPSMNPAEIVRQFAGLAAEPGAPAERAEALLAQVQRVVRVDAGTISLLPPDQDAHAFLARTGFDQRVGGYLD